MAAQLRVVRRRIRTVQSTQKITRAFELISASRVVRAQQRVEASRPYTNQVTQALTSVANTEVTISHPLLEPRAGSGRPGSWSSPPIGVWPGPTTPTCCGPRPS
jgi:F-type H+-transporting ATPase subunit gamma